MEADKRRLAGDTARAPTAATEGRIRLIYTASCAECFDDGQAHFRHARLRMNIDWWAIKWGHGDKYEKEESMLSGAERTIMPPWYYPWYHS